MRAIRSPSSDHSTPRIDVCVGTLLSLALNEKDQSRRYSDHVRYLSMHSVIGGWLAARLLLLVATATIIDQ